MSVSVKLFCVCILAIGLDAKPFPDVRDVVSNGPEVFVFTLPGSSGLQGQPIGSYGINRVATRRSLEKPPSATSATKAEQSNVIQSETDDSITFPDDVVRDSYGNAVTPFSAIPGTDKIKNRIGSDEVAFLLPSYADGILAKLPETPKSDDYTSNDIQIPSTDLQPPLSSAEVPASNYHHQSASFPTLAPGTFPTLALAASFPTLAPIQAAAAPNVQQPQSHDNSLVVVTRGPHNAVQSVVTGNVQAPAAVNSGSYGNALQNNPFFNGAAGASGALVSTGVKTGFVSTSSAAKPYAINPSNPFIYG